MTGGGPLDADQPASAEELDRIAPDALALDRYLDRLLAGGDRGPHPVLADSRLDPAIGAAAERLQRDLVRFHPSFRFEERVAARLAELATRMRLPAAAGAESTGFAAPSPLQLHRLPDPDLVAIAAGTLDPSAPEGAPMPRTVLIGGAMASAAISIAGVAYVAWRASRGGRPQGAPMVRAVRAARFARRDRGRDRRAGAAAWRRAARVMRPS